MNERKSSLQEFEELEKNLKDESSDYQVVTKKNGDHKSKRQNQEQSAPFENNAKPDHSKTINKNTNETGAERQRLAKEKQEFRKQKEKLESEKLTLEKQKRDLDKQKLEFEKTKDVEWKKINAEKQKMNKEKKALNRQNDKKKDDNALTDKLYKEIELLKDELRKKENKVRFILKS
jgi:hypothetical protein